MPYSVVRMSRTQNIMYILYVQQFLYFPYLQSTLWPFCFFSLVYRSFQDVPSTHTASDCSSCGSGTSQDCVFSRSIKSWFFQNYTLLADYTEGWDLEIVVCGQDNYIVREWFQHGFCWYCKMSHCCNFFFFFGLFGANAKLEVTGFSAFRRSLCLLEKCLLFPPKHTSPAGDWHWGGKAEPHLEAEGVSL